MKRVKFEDDYLAEAIYEYTTINYDKYSAWCEVNAFNNKISMAHWVYQNDLDDFMAFCKEKYDLEITI